MKKLPNIPRSRLKYNTAKKKLECDGYKFDSRREMFRYVELREMLKEGMISDLKLQPVFYISKGCVDPATKKRLPARKYIPDFQYKEKNTQNTSIVVEDVKSTETAKNSTYRLKRQLFLEQYPQYRFREVF